MTSFEKILVTFYYPLSVAILEKEAIDFTGWLPCHSKDDEKSIVLSFGKTLISKAQIVEHEVFEFEYNCCRLLFSDLAHSSEYRFFIADLTSEGMATIYKKSEKSTVITYINTDSSLSSCSIDQHVASVLKGVIQNNYLLEPSVSDLVHNFFLSISAKIFKTNRFKFQIFTNRLQKRHSSINLQWHITNACQNKCKHCYLQSEEDYLGIKKDHLNLSEMKKVVDELYAYSLKIGAPARIILSGGDPMLSPFFWDLLEYGNLKKTYPMISGLLGNPNLVDQSAANRLKQLGIKTFQFSLEGLRSIDAELRGKDNWFQVWRAIECLETVGIRTNIMFTLSNMNKSELIPLINFCAESSVSSFSFARFCATNSDSTADILGKNELHHLMLRTLETFRFWKADKKSLTNWDLFKDPLNALLYSELGFKFYSQKPGCCLLGNSRSLAMLPTGVILYCRRIPAMMGVWPDMSFERALEKQTEVSYLKQSESKCIDCPVKADCRGGCRAVNYRSFPSIMACHDTQCWRN